MVSFQCHACGDVVKKPKLDQHRTRCHSGFDCIDCSTTFNIPQEYKNHTSCITEAEKYQKSLYKGPKKGIATPRHNDDLSQEQQLLPGVSERQSNAQWNHVPESSRQSFRGGPNRGGYGNGRYGAWCQSRSKVTGANDTPLGTPNRCSPLPKSAAIPPSPQKNGQNFTVQTNGAKRKLDRADDKVDRNQKASNKKAKLSALEDCVSIPLPASDSPGVETQIKKGKKETKPHEENTYSNLEDREMGGINEDEEVNKETEAKLNLDDEQPPLEKKKRTKQKHEENRIETPAAVLKERKKHKKSKAEVETTDENSRSQTDAKELKREENKSERKKKKKRGVEEVEKINDGANVDEAAAPDSLGVDEIKSKKKKEKPVTDHSGPKIPNTEVMKKDDKKFRKDKKDRQNSAT